MHEVFFVHDLAPGDYSLALLDGSGNGLDVRRRLIPGLLRRAPVYDVVGLQKAPAQRAGEVSHVARSVPFGGVREPVPPLGQLYDGGRYVLYFVVRHGRGIVQALEVLAHVLFYVLYLTIFEEHQFSRRVLRQVERGYIQQFLHFLVGVLLRVADPGCFVEEVFHLFLHLLRNLRALTVGVLRAVRGPVLDFLRRYGVLVRDAAGGEYVLVGDGPYFVAGLARPEPEDRQRPGVQANEHRQGEPGYRQDSQVQPRPVQAADPAPETLEPRRRAVQVTGLLSRGRGLFVGAQSLSNVPVRLPTPRLCCHKRPRSSSPGRSGLCRLF